MARSLFRDTICYRGPAGLIPLAGASVTFYEVNGTGPPTTPIAYPLYPDATSTAPIPIPYLTGPVGELELWSDDPHRVRILVAKPGLATADEIIDLDLDPAESATDPEVAAAVEAHEAKEDPHEQYLLTDEANLVYLPTGYAYSKAESDLKYLPAGSAYTKDESDARYRLASDPTEDAELRAYVQQIMAVLDPGGPPPPAP